MLSIIVPITGENRRQQADIFLHLLRQQAFTNYEVILVEQVNALLGGKCLGGPFYTDLPVDQYIAIEQKNGENHFNQPWMANVGARAAKGENFLFLDIDITFNPNYLEEIYAYSKPFFIAHSHVTMLSQSSTEKLRSLRTVTDLGSLDGDHVESGALKFAGFSVCAQRDFFWDCLGGYNENYLGWGGNDNDIAWRAKTILGEEFLPNQEIYHMWHPKPYSKFLSMHRKGTWLTTYNNPKVVTDRLKRAPLGDLTTPSFIKLDDIWVDPTIKKNRNL